MLKKLIRKNINDLKPYRSARLESDNTDGILLDANENSVGSVLSEGINRYPDPLQKKLREKIAGYKNIPAEHIFLGNGSDEAIDLLIRAFCEPRQDNIVICPPTYGVYQVCAGINDIEVLQVPLTTGFQPDTDQIISKMNQNTKLIFLCSPNNPTGNLIQHQHIQNLLGKFHGLLIVDEAYIDFADDHSCMNMIKSYPNLVVLQTFSKAWGLANLRMGMALANTEIIEVLNKIKYPYNINGLTQSAVSGALYKSDLKDKMIAEIIDQRDFLVQQLKKFSFVRKIFPSDANFLLIRFADAKTVYQYLLSKNIIVRDRSNLIHCENCLRITVGNAAENVQLLNALKNLEK